MGLLDFIIGQGTRTAINTIRRNSQNVPPRGTVIHPRVVSDGKRLVTGPEAQKILQEQEAQKTNASISPNRMVWDPTNRRFILNASTPDNTVTQSNPVKPEVKPEDKKIVTETPTYHVGGLNINDGIQQGVGLTPKIDMLGLTKSPTTDSETTPQPDYMRFVNPVMPYVQNYFRVQNNTTKFPMKDLPIEGLTFNKVYNKRDTRQWLWDQGIDPYTLTGRQRKKIRNDLNATGTTNFKINGVTPIAMKNGSKLIKNENPVNKFRRGGSLKRIPFYQRGTPKGGVKRNKAKEFYYPTKKSTQDKVLNYFISQGLGIPEGRTEPGKFEYFLVDGLKLPPRIVKPVFDGLYNTGNFIKEIQSQPILRESPYERINRVNKIIDPIIKSVNK